MDEKLTNKLKEKYPLIFTENFYFECDNGWYNILDSVCYKIQSYIDDHAPKVPQIEATQVKEKFGGLRFYFGGGDDFIYELIHEAERKSTSVCETCGEPGSIINKRNWLVCRCTACKI